jgi:transposase
MLTGMTERDWSIVLEVFDAVQSSRGEPGHDDRKFLEAVHYFTVHSITWRALPGEFGKWNSVWKRFWRLSRSGVFEAFFQLLAECSQTAHLVHTDPHKGRLTRTGIPMRAHRWFDSGNGIEPGWQAYGSTAEGDAR